MAGGRFSSFEDRGDDSVLVQGQFEGLADMNVVERLCEVVHGEVVDRQIRSLAEVGAGFRRCVFSRWDSGNIDLVGEVGLVACRGRFVEDLVDFSKLCFGTPVVVVAYKDDTRGMVV